MTYATLSFPRKTDARDAAAPPLAAWLLGALFLGAIALLSLPAARAANGALGWMPLWLLGMPLASLAALAASRFHLRLPRRRMPDSSPAMRRRRPGTTQASRRAAPAVRRRLPRAA
ncbi:MAG TPA: hypothetical protein VFF71_11675 [Luteimonas sp.]|nr:hypothetical protein [Luteimonas sp.]